MCGVEVIVFGSAIVDFICYCPRFPKVGETITGTRFCTGFGGKGANQCVAAARLGAASAMVATVGADQWGRDYINNMAKEGVRTEFMLAVDGEDTGIAAITVSDTGANQIVIVPGANNKLSAATFKQALKRFPEPKILICQLETRVAETIEVLKLFEGISILNAAPAIENAPVELIQNASILCINESEASTMTGAEILSVQDAKNAITDLVAVGAKTVILTMGKQGAVYSDIATRTVIHVPVDKVEDVVDTTGAGDAFIGALAYFLAKHPHQSLTQVIGAACEIAAISVRHCGTQSSFPYAKAIEGLDLITKNYKNFVV